MKSLNFERDYWYPSRKTGITVPVVLSLGGNSITVQARLDTGASFCLFDLTTANALGIEAEAGDPKRFSTLAGSFMAYGHEVSLSTLGLEWDATVFFYPVESPESNYLGRTGWLDRMQLGLVHYGQRLYLSHYDSNTAI